MIRALKCVIMIILALAVAKVLHENGNLLHVTTFNAVINPFITLVELTRGPVLALLKALKHLKDLIFLCLGAIHVEIQLVELNFQGVQFNISFSVQVPLLPFHLGPIVFYFIAVDWAIGPLQFRVDFLRLSWTNGRLSAQFSVTIRCQRD